MTQVTNDMITIAMDYVHAQYTNANHPCSRDAVCKQDVIDAVKAQLENGVAPADVKMDPEKINQGIIAYIQDSLKDIDPELWGKMQLVASYRYSDTEALLRGVPRNFNCFDIATTATALHEENARPELNALCWQYANYNACGNLYSFCVAISEIVGKIDKYTFDMYEIAMKNLDVNDMKTVRDAYIAGCEYYFVKGNGVDWISYCLRTSSGCKFDILFDSVSDGLFHDEFDEEDNDPDHVKSRINESAQCAGYSHYSEDEWAFIR